jgi:hypothetical protein
VVTEKGIIIGGWEEGAKIVGWGMRAWVVIVGTSATTFEKGAAVITVTVEVIGWGNSVSGMRTIIWEDGYFLFEYLFYFYFLPLNFI